MNNGNGNNGKRINNADRLIVNIEVFDKNFTRLFKLRHRTMAEVIEDFKRKGII